MEIFDNQLKELRMAELRLARKILNALLLKSKEVDKKEYIEKGIQEINQAIQERQIQN